MYFGQHFYFMCVLQTLYEKPPDSFTWTAFWDTFAILAAATFIGLGVSSISEAICQYAMEMQAELRSIREQLEAKR